MGKKLAITFTLIFIGLFLLRIYLVFNRIFDQDELEHIHAAWNISQGKLIYVDFFENHPPLIHFLLQPVFNLTGNTFNTLYAARILMLLFTTGIFYFTYLIAKDFWDRQIGICAIALLSTMIIFLEKSLEFRPDTPMTFFWLMGLYAVIRSLMNEKRGFFFGGLSIAISLLFSPKAIFGYAGIIFALFFVGFRNKESYMKSLLLLHLGIFIPGVLFFVWLLANENLMNFYQNNVLFNAMIDSTYRLTLLKIYLGKSSYQNILFWISGILGAVYLIKDKNQPFPQKSILLFSLLFLIIGLVINPSPNRQYYLLFLPILSIVGSFFMISFLRRIITKKRIIRLATLGVLIFLFLLPLKWIYAQCSIRNTDQLKVMEYVMSLTTPDESVFDCWTGLYVFRNNAFYYHYLNMDVLSVIDISKLENRLINELRANNCKVVILDRHFQFLPRRVRQYIALNYSSRFGYPKIILVRK